MLRKLVIALAFTLALPMSASADSLVAAARAERARRAALKKRATVVVQTGKPSSKGTINQAKPKASSSDTKQPAAKQEADKTSSDKDKADWKKRFEDARQAIQDAEQDLEDAGRRVDVLRRDLVYSDGNEFNRRAQQDAAFAEKDAAEKALAAARAALEKLKEEARRAGVPASQRR